MEISETVMLIKAREKRITPSKQNSKCFPKLNSLDRNEFEKSIALIILNGIYAMHLALLSVFT